MKSICKSLAKRVFTWVVIAVLMTQTVLTVLPQTAYAANVEPSASTQSVFTNYQPEVIAYQDPTSGFIHPGVGVTKAILENARQQVRGGVEPWKSYFETMLLDNPGVSGENVGPSWKGGTQILDSQGNNGSFIADASKAYAQAVMYFITGNNAYRRNALKIIREYEKNDPETMTYLTDACIHSGIPLNRICIAAEIIRYSTYTCTDGYTDAELQWTDADTE